MGGFVAMLYGARHPGHASGLVLQSTMARFDLARLVEGFRRADGDEIAEIAMRSYGGSGEPVTPDEWARCFAAFGPTVPGNDALARRVQNLDLGPRGAELLRQLDVLDELERIDRPTLVCVGELDPVTPVAASREILGAFSEGIGRLAIVQGAGHFPWLDAPDEYWRLLTEFVGAAKAY